MNSLRSISELQSIASRLGAICGLSEQSINPPDRGSRLLALAVLAAVAGVSVGLRLLEWPAWVHADAFVDGLPLMPTADAYAWLAGAEGAGRMAGWPMAVLIEVLSTMTGQPPAWVAFWLPVLLAPVPAVLIAGLCIRMGHPSAGLPAGILAGSGLAFLARTRLGYADTDLFALAVAVAFAGACAAQAVRLGTIRAETRPGRDAGLRLAACVVLLWAWMLLYPSGYPLALAVLVAMAGYALWTAGRTGSGPVLVFAGAVLAAGHFGLAGLGIGLAIGLAVCALWGLGYFRPGLASGAAVLGAMVFAIGLGEAEFIEQSVRRVAVYTGLGPAPPPVGDWLLPRVDDSILETVGIGPAEFARRAGSHWTLLAGGLAGYGLALWRWPVLVTFLPLLALGLSGFVFGHRFAMYATPVLGLGLGLGLVVVGRYMRLKPAQSVACQILLAVAIGGLLGWRALELHPDPALEPGHARVLAALRERPAGQGRVWTWWDAGYAAQYYSGLPTLADGGNTSRQRIFALGRVFGADSARGAAKFIRLGAMARVAAMNDAEQWRETTYASRPLAMLEGMPAAEAQREIDRLASRTRMWPGALPDEFMVVSWQTLRQAQWINYFARWTLTGGAQGYGQIVSLKPPVELDEQQGLLHTPDGTVPLISLDILDENSHYRNRWPRGQGAHAVINNANGEGVLMDASLYEMMAVQMLIGEPERFAEHFELVADEFPAARVYRVR